MHLSIGQVYAFSVFKTPLVAHFHSSLTAIGVIFSISIVMLGLSAAVLGTWVERSGPRKSMLAAALCWSVGFLVGAVGVASDQLWVVYLGYGFIGGIGLGIGYISPVSTLIKWFPDRPGLATGLAIMGFGGGALIASPLSSRLLETSGGSGSDGIAASFVTLGLVYLVVMTLGFAARVPADGWAPEGWTAPDEHKGMRTTANVTAANAIRTRSFWLLWVVLFCNVTAGIGILEQASPMIQDFFGSVDAEAAAGYVGLLSLANMSGRFVWSSASVPSATWSSRSRGRPRSPRSWPSPRSSSASTAAASPPSRPTSRTCSAVSRSVPSRLLTAWSAAGVAGPLIVNKVADNRLAAGAEGADLCRTSLFMMVGVLVVGFLANLAIRAVDERHHDPETTDGAAARGVDLRTAPDGARR